MDKLHEMIRTAEKAISEEVKTLADYTESSEIYVENRIKFGYKDLDARNISSHVDTKIKIVVR